MDTDLRLSAVRGQILAEDDGGGSSHPDREVSQDWCQDGPPLLVPPDTEQSTDRIKLLAHTSSDRFHNLDVAVNIFTFSFKGY